MLFTLMMLLTTTTAQAAEKEGVKCTALYRKAPAQGRIVEIEQPLIVVEKYPSVVRHEVTLEGRFFSVNEDLNEGDLLGFIVHSDNNSKGIVSNAGLNSSGRYTLTEVDGEVIYRLVCTGQRADKPVKERF